MTPTTGFVTGFHEIPLAELRQSPLNPRKHFKAEAMKELTASVTMHGVLTPLLVRPVNGHYDIAAGHRRYLAAKAAKLERVPAVVREMSDAEFLEVLTIENLQREDLHPLEEADGYRQLMKLDAATYTAETIAAKVGKSVSYVYQRLKLVDLAPSARKAFLEEELTAGHAILIARLQPKDQDAAVTFTFDDRFGYRQPKNATVKRHAVSVRDLAHWIGENVHMDLHAAPWKKDDATLVPAAGACTTCPKRTGANEALFPDIAKKDTCTDGACFQTKRAAFDALQRAELEEQIKEITTAKGAKPVELSTLETWQRPRGKGEARGLDKESWHKATGKCKAAQTGVVVEGDGVGKEIKVCVDRACKSLGDTGRYHASEQRSRQAQRAAEKKRTAEMQRRRALLRGVLAAAPAKPSDEDLRLIGRRYLTEMHRDNLKLLAAALEVADTKAKGWTDPAPGIRKLFETGTPAQVTRALLGCALISAINVSPYGPTGGTSTWTELQAIAKRFKAKPLEAPKKPAKKASAAAAKNASATKGTRR